MHCPRLISVAAFVLLSLGCRAACAQSRADSPAGIPQLSASQCAPLQWPATRLLKQRPWLDRRLAPECRALTALSVLTADEKAHFGAGDFSEFGPPPPGTAATPFTAEQLAARSASQSGAAKLRLPTIGRGSDGPNGIADMSGLFPGGKPAARSLGVTAFPNVIVLGASWDRELAARFGRALGEEFRGKGMTQNLGPTMNLIRTWHGGRSAETFSEDPYLMTELVVPEIKAMQGQGVIAMIKHFAGNNQEHSRIGTYPDMAGVDEHISEKALQELYLPHFKAAVQRARAGAVMCAYNKVNGEFACNNAGLLGRLRDWGFDGVIVPDAAFAQRDAVAAARAGVDSASPTEAVSAAIGRGEVDAQFFDRAVYRRLVTRFRHGIYDHPTKGAEDAIVSTPDHARLAQDIASSGAVLLKNAQDVLPLQGLRSLAVIGADAGADTVTMETGSPNVYVQTPSVPLDAIRARAGAGVAIEHARGSAGIRPLAAVPSQVFTSPAGEGPGLSGTYFRTHHFSQPAITRLDAVIDFGSDPKIPAVDAAIGAQGPPMRSPPWSAQWTGRILPPATGEYAFSLTGAGTAELYIDHQLVVTVQRADFTATGVGTIRLTAGKPATVLIKYDSGSAALGSGIRLGWMPPDDRLERAVQAARKADVAVVFVGEQLGEGHDKLELALPGDQNALIEAVAAANPRTVVVLHTSNPVAMPWIEKVAAVIEAWYPGQASGTSIAALLFGDVNPSGKLPVTFPRDSTQGPATRPLSYPGNGQSVLYDEGVFVGYRWYDHHGQEPLFPFGHGLSYTVFEYSGLTISGDGNDRRIDVTVTNKGKRAGAEVVQLYVGLPPEAQDPPQQLKGFEKIRLEPGESRRVSLPLDAERLSAFDAASGQWRLFPGRYAVGVGSSSRDIRVRGEFSLAAQ